MTRHELRRENDELRAALDLRGYRTIEEWETLPLTLREQLAARAWIAEWGDAGRGLIRLGFPAMYRLPPDKIGAYKDHVTRVFETLGVREIVRRNLARLDVEREAILSKQLQIALYGEDADSTKAATLLIKVCGWEFQGDPAPFGGESTIEPLLHRPNPQAGVLEPAMAQSARVCSTFNKCVAIGNSEQLGTMDRTESVRVASNRNLS